MLDLGQPVLNALTGWENELLAIGADKDYTPNRIRQQIADEGALAVIPSKSYVRKLVPHDRNLYSICNIVESFFC